MVHFHAAQSVLIQTHWNKHTHREIYADLCGSRAFLHTQTVNLLVQKGQWEPLRLDLGSELEEHLCTDSHCLLDSFLCITVEICKLRQNIWNRHGEVWSTVSPESEQSILPVFICFLKSRVLFQSSSENPGFWKSRVLKIQGSENPGFWKSRVLKIQGSENPGFWKSGVSKFKIQGSENPGLCFCENQRFGKPRVWGENLGFWKSSVLIAAWSNLSF